MKSRVSKAASYARSFFEINISQKFGVMFPSKTYEVSSFLERNKKNDIQINIQTALNFDQGTIIAAALSDSPCFVKFKSCEILPNLKGSASFTNDDKNPIRSSFKYKGEYKNFKYEEKLRFNVLEYPFDWPSSVDLLLDTWIKFDDLYISALIHKQSHSIQFEEGYSNKYGIHKFCLGYDWVKRRFKTAELISSYSWRNFDFDLIIKRLNRSFSLSAKYNYDISTQYGILFESVHLGNNPELIAYLAYKKQLEDESVIRFVASTNRTVRGSIGFKYDRYITMEFTGGIKFGKNAIPTSTSYGTTIVFQKV